MTNSDSKHYEFFTTRAKVGEAVSPPADPSGQGWTILHVTSSDAGSGDTVIVIWSKPKKR